MQVKIFSFSDDAQGLEKSVNAWLSEEGKGIEIISRVQNSTYDDYMKKVVVIITIWYNTL